MMIFNFSVRQHLLGLIYMGFLVPVLGPAITQVQTLKLPLESNFLEFQCIVYSIS